MRPQNRLSPPGQQNLACAVAVKINSKRDFSPSSAAFKELLREVRVLALYPHPRIVELIGQVIVLVLGGAPLITCLFCFVLVDRSFADHAVPSSLVPYPPPHLIYYLHSLQARV